MLDCFLFPLLRLQSPNLHLANINGKMILLIERHEEIRISQVDFEEKRTVFGEYGLSVVGAKAERRKRDTVGRELPKCNQSKAYSVVATGHSDALF